MLFEGSNQGKCGRHGAHTILEVKPTDKETTLENEVADERII
jgi:hypothetical protein